MQPAVARPHDHPVEAVRVGPGVARVVGHRVPVVEPRRPPGRAVVDRDDGVADGAGAGALVDRLLLDVGQQVVTPAPLVLAAGGAVDARGGHPGPAAPAGRQVAAGVVVGVAGQGDLLEVVLALGPGGGLADLLHGGQQHADEHGDDGEHHQQLDQREGRARSHRGATPRPPDVGPGRARPPGHR